MDIDEALSFANYIYKNKEEELLFQRWTNDLHLQISFEEFKKMLKPEAKPKEENVEDTLEKVRVITTLMKGVN